MITGDFGKTIVATALQNRSIRGYGSRLKAGTTLKWNARFLPFSPCGSLKGRGEEECRRGEEEYRSRMSNALMRKPGNDGRFKVRYNVGVPSIR
jgi:hypothetical protein